mgnify:CR=1 FL=1
MSQAQAPVQVGQLTTCQFGNSFDSDYTVEKNENVQVKVLAIRDGICGKLYLVRAGSKLGTATRPEGRRAEVTAGELYCTCAVTYGEGMMFPYLEKAAKSLGFSNVEL